MVNSSIILKGLVIGSHTYLCLWLTDEYDLIKGNIQYNDCMQMCSEDAACRGVEYRWGDDNVQQCELWHVEIKSRQQQNKWDLDCCIKEYQ